MSKQVYVVEIRRPGDGDDEWLVAFYAEDKRAPAAFALAVFEHARDAQNAAATFDPAQWDARVRLASLRPMGAALRTSGRGVSAGQEPR